MNLADKIIYLRKKKGWSQEELADRVNVSRQAVSKWESMQAVPDIDKIIQLSEIFDVTTDYLLRDENGVQDLPPATEEVPTRTVSMQEAESYLAHNQRFSRWLALGVALCILSPICLIVLSGCAEYAMFGINETLAVAIGLPVLLILVAIAVGLFVYGGLKNAPYEYLEKENCKAERYVREKVETAQNQFRNTYITMNIVGACLCVLSPIPLVTTAILQQEFLTLCMVGVLLFLVSVAVALFVFANTRWEGWQRVVGSAEDREENKTLLDRIMSLYWAIATAIYFAWSFLFDAWTISWVVWPIAGVLCGIVESLIKIFIRKK